MEILKKRFFIIGFSFLAIIFLMLTYDLSKIFFEKNQIIVGAKNCTENQILSEMIAILIENKTNLKVKRKFFLEGTHICFEALKSKSIDIYPEFTGTALLTILKGKKSINNIENSYEYLKKVFLEKFNIEWLYPFGFENKYVLLISKSKKDKYSISKISDLKNFENLTFAFDPEFLIRDELFQIQKKYSLKTPNIMIDQSLIYFSLNSNIVDIANGFSTDPKIIKYDLFTLEDDKKALPEYLACPIARKDILDKYPQLKIILKSLQNKVTTETILKLNFLAEEKGENPYDIAREFLLTEKILL
ncbi:MAG: hypothetical protein JXA94_01475 [Parachlamydiales bacterium]|nr:hypothetical protein [Parachlamydiales bacterium]